MRIDFFEVKDVPLNSDQQKLLRQIWREDHPDCATFEQVVGRLLLQKVIRDCRLRSSFNLLRRMQKTHSNEDIIAELKRRELPTAGIERLFEKNDEDKSDAASDNSADTEQAG